MVEMFYCQTPITDASTALKKNHSMGHWQNTADTHDNPSPLQEKKPQKQSSNHKN